MKKYDTILHEEPGLFRETHMVRNTGKWQEHILLRCSTFFESVWYPDYQPHHYAIDKTLYELILEGTYCHMEKDKILTELHAGTWVVTQLARQMPGHYDKVFSAPLKRIGILVENTPFQQMLNQMFFNGEKTVLGADATAPFRHLLESLGNKIQNSGDDETISLLLLELTQKIAGLRYPTTAGLDRRLDRFLLESQDASYLNVSELASHFGVSRRTLCRVFRKKFNTSPGEYLAGCRLEKAKNMLVIPDLEIKEIARLCGYSSANFFTRCFRKKYNLTPREYRTGKADRTKNGSGL